MACWVKVYNYDKENAFPPLAPCRGFEISKYKSAFQEEFKQKLLFHSKVEETWNCVDKNGKKAEIYMNTFTGKFKIS